MYLRFLYIIAHVKISFLFKSNIFLCEWIPFCSCAHPSMDTCVDSSFVLMWMVFLWVWMCIYQGVSYMNPSQQQLKYTHPSVVLRKPMHPERCSNQRTAHVCMLLLRHYPLIQTKAMQSRQSICNNVEKHI